MIEHKNEIKKILDLVIDASKSENVDCYLFVDGKADALEVNLIDKSRDSKDPLRYRNFITRFKDDLKTIEDLLKYTKGSLKGYLEVQDD